MIKKYSLVVLSILALSLVGCGDTDENRESVESIVVVQDEKVATDESLQIEKTELPKENENKEVAKDLKEEIKTEKQYIEPTEQAKLNDFNGKIDYNDFRVIIKGYAILMGTDMNEIIDYLGEPDICSSAQGCVNEGEDKQYVYGGYTIYTYSDGDKDIIYLIEFTEDACTDANIGLGSTKEDVENAYGTEYDYNEVNGYVTYEVDENACLSLKYDNNEVSYLDMYYR